MSINIDPSAHLTKIQNLSDKLQRAMAPASGMDYEAVMKLSSEIENAAYSIFNWADKLQTAKEEAEWEAQEAEYTAKVRSINDWVRGVK